MQLFFTPNSYNLKLYFVLTYEVLVIGNERLSTKNISFRQVIIKFLKLFIISYKCIWNEEGELLY